MSDSKLSITPVLSSTIGFLTDVRDQVSTLVRFVIMNPGWTSSLWEKDLISFRKMASKFEYDRNELSSNLSSAIQETLTKKFKDYNFDTAFTTSDYVEGEDDGRFSIAFNILLTPIRPNEEVRQESGLVSGTIHVDPHTNDISINYENTLDNQLI